MKKVEITTRNVEYLWELYEKYLEECKEIYYSDFKPKYFEEFVESEIHQCSNCKEYKLEKNMGVSELALKNEICDDCIFNGYGE